MVLLRVQKCIFPRRFGRKSYCDRSTHKAIWWSLIRPLSTGWWREWRFATWESWHYMLLVIYNISFSWWMDERHCWLLINIHHVSIAKGQTRLKDIFVHSVLMHCSTSGSPCSNPYSLRSTYFSSWSINLFLIFVWPLQNLLDHLQSSSSPIRNTSRHPHPIIRTPRPRHPSP